MAKLSMKVCKLDKTPICELIDNTSLRARNINENFAINEVTTLSFDLPVVKNGKWKNVSNETLIFFNDEYYNVKSLQFTHSKEGQLLLHVEAKHLSEILASQLISVEETTPRNIIELLKIALLYDENGVSQTGWTIGDIDVDKVKTRGLEANEQSPFSIILTIVEKWDAIAIFDSKTMKVNVIPSKNTEHPSLDLRVSKNLQEVTITYDTSEICTRLYGYGGQDDAGNDLDIMSVNPTGKPYVDNFDYFVNKGYTLEYIKANPQMFVRTNIYREESIYDPQDLYDNTVVELEKVSQPKVDVQIQALNTTRIRANNIVNVGLGDCVLVHDEDLGMSFVCNVIKKSVDYENPHLLNVELVNSIQYRDIIAELFNSVNNVSSIVHSGNIAGATSMDEVQDYLNLHYLSTEQLDAKYIDAETIRTEYLDAEQIKGQYLDVESAGLQYATIGSLNAIEAQIKDLDVDALEAELATIQELVAEKADIKDLQAAEANIDKLTAADATITGKLEVVEAEIGNLDATYATIGSLDAYKIDVENLLADKATIKDLETTNAKIENLDATYAKIDDLDVANADIKKLQTEDATIKDLVATKATITDLNATNATITNLQTELVTTNELVAKKVDADYVDAEIVKATDVIANDITVINGTIENLDSKYATIEYLDGEVANIDTLLAKKATIDELNSAKASIGSLDANVANINSVLAGNVGTGLLQTVHLTGKNVVIDDAVIKSANIESIDTDVVTVGNDNIILSGSTQQFKDADGNVRVQIGQDAEGNFSFIIADEDGATVIDADGVTENAIPNGLIKDTMVADDAGIQASKVKYVSKDGNTTLQTIITQQQGEISELIKETTIDGESLKDKYLETVKTVDGIETTIGDVSMLGDGQSLVSSITSIKATADGITTKVSSIGGQNLFYYSTKEWIKKTSGEDYVFVGCYKEDTDNDMEGKNVTLSVEIQTDNTTRGTFDICYYGVEDPTVNDIHILHGQIPLTDLVDGKYIKTFVYPTTPNFTASQDDSAAMITMAIRVSNITGEFSVRKGMLQYGQLATEWQPSSDNVSESVTIAQQDAGKIYWLVKSGTNATNFELTPRTATLVADEINLKGLVTFSGLDGSVPSHILEPLANEPTTGSTVIHGGYISSQTINADQLIIEDIFAAGNSVMNIINAQDIDATRIKAGTIKSNFLELYGLEVKQKDTGVTTLYVEHTGDITMRGSLESYNYVSGVSGWGITKDGNAEFNDVIVRGDLINTDGGISSDVGNTKTVRFWAGAPYAERENAPWIVYNDGSMLATEGTFSGVFTGEIEIGNISIVDPSKNAGNDAIVTIQNGDNGIKVVQLRDTNQSDFAQNINITDNFYNSKILLGQDGVGTFSSGVIVGDSSKSITLDNDSIKINGSEINASSGTINVLSNDFKVGSASSNNNLEVWGATTLKKDMTILGDINIGNKWKVHVKSNGIDIDFV